MRTAWILPGQGSLRTGCLGELLAADGPADLRTAATDAVEQVGQVLGRDLVAVCDDPEAGARTADAQPAILTVSLAVAAALRAAGLRPDLVAGHSLGECTAAVVAGVYDLEDGARVVAERGRAMGAACQATPGAMAALVKLAPAAVEDLLRAHPDVVVANDNAPGQVVLAGPPAAIAAVRDDARAAGGRMVPLQVEGAFHSTAMAAAEPALRDALAAATAHDAQVPLLSGVDVVPHTAGAEVAAGLLDGLLHPVRWREVQLALAAQGVTHLVEVGPGGVLTGLAKRTVPDLEVRAVATPADAAALAEELLATAS